MEPEKFINPFFIFFIILYKNLHFNTLFSKFAPQVKQIDSNRVFLILPNTIIF